jgi:hypothetical protein
MTKYRGLCETLCFARLACPDVQCGKRGSSLITESNFVRTSIWARQLQASKNDFVGHDSLVKDKTWTFWVPKHGSFRMAGCNVVLAMRSRSPWSYDTGSLIQHYISPENSCVATIGCKIGRNHKQRGAYSQFQNVRSPSHDAKTTVLDFRTK